MYIKQSSNSFFMVFKVINLVSDCKMIDFCKGKKSVDRFKRKEVYL